MAKTAKKTAALDLPKPEAKAWRNDGAPLYTAIVEDAKLLYAHDVASDTPPRRLEDYFTAAIDEVRANHRNYGRTRTVRPGEPQKIGF